MEEPDPGSENDDPTEEESPNDTRNEEIPEDVSNDNERQELLRSLLDRLWSRLLGFLSHFGR